MCGRPLDNTRLLCVWDLHVVFIHGLLGCWNSADIDWLIGGMIYIVAYHWSEVDNIADHSFFPFSYFFYHSVDWKELKWLFWEQKCAICSISYRVCGKFARNVWTRRLTEKWGGCALRIKEESDISKIYDILKYIFRRNSILNREYEKWDTKANICEIHYEAFAYGNEAERIEIACLRNTEKENLDMQRLKECTLLGKER